MRKQFAPMLKTQNELQNMPFWEICVRPYYGVYDNTVIIYYNTIGLIVEEQ